MFSQTLKRGYFWSVDLINFTFDFAFSKAGSSNKTVHYVCFIPDNQFSDA